MEENIMRIKNVWLKYQQVTGLSLDTIKDISIFNASVYKSGITDYIQWLEDEHEKHIKDETTIIGSVDTPFNKHNLFNPDNPQGLG
jgi:hypothetical protein